MKMHYHKLVDRQQKNNNVASPVFAFIPIGSTVAIQREDGRPWTHGTIVDTATIIIMTDHTQYNLHQMADVSHAINDT